MNTQERIEHIRAHSGRLRQLIVESGISESAALRINDRILDATVDATDILAKRAAVASSPGSRRIKLRRPKPKLRARSWDAGPVTASWDGHVAEPAPPSPEARDPLARPLAPDPSLDRAIPMSDAEYERINKRASISAVKKAVVPRYANVHPKQECPICMGTVDSHPFDVNVLGPDGRPFLRLMCGDMYVCDGSVYVPPTPLTKEQVAEFQG